MSKQRVPSAKYAPSSANTASSSHATGGRPSSAPSKRPPSPSNGGPLNNSSHVGGNSNSNSHSSANQTSSYNRVKYTKGKIRLLDDLENNGNCVNDRSELRRLRTTEPPPSKWIRRWSYKNNGRIGGTWIGRYRQWYWKLTAQRPQSNFARVFPFAPPMEGSHSTRKQ